MVSASARTTLLSAYQPFHPDKEPGCRVYAGIPARTSRFIWMRSQSVESIYLFPRHIFDIIVEPQPPMPGY